MMAGIMLAVMTAMTSCEISKVRVITDGGEMVTQIRPLKGFEEIEISGSPTVVYQQADSFSVKVEGPSEQVKNILTSVNGSVLNIRNRGKIGIINISSGEGGTVVYVSSPDLTAVRLSGSGDFISERRVDTDKMQIELRGSGDIRFSDIICDQCSTMLVGSGDLSLDHLDAQTSDVVLIGSGDINIAESRVRKTDIQLRGSGDIVVDFQDGCGRAECQVSGSGDISLRGRLKSYNYSKFGSGDIDIDGLVVGNQ